MLEFWGFIFIVCIGTLGHFAYEWSNHNKTIALFFAVNESTWEHMKLAIGPSFLWMFVELLFMGSNSNFIFSKLVSLIVIMLVIPLFFYGYRSITKKDVLFLDIFEFFLAIALGQYCSYLIMNANAVPNIVNTVSHFLILIIFIAYLYHTFVPPKHFIFKDPLTNKYGVEGHYEKDNMK